MICIDPIIDYIHGMSWSEALTYTALVIHTYMPMNISTVYSLTHEAHYLTISVYIQYYQFIVNS